MAWLLFLRPFLRQGKQGKQAARLRKRAAGGAKARPYDGQHGRQSGVELACPPRRASGRQASPPFANFIALAATAAGATGFPSRRQTAGKPQGRQAAALQRGKDPTLGRRAWGTREGNSRFSGRGSPVDSTGAGLVGCSPATAGKPHPRLPTAGRLGMTKGRSRAAREVG